ncbi:MAG: hypothetical protein C4527_08555 [Candidatus Omnitrophota bacterium]|jgi:hypothetical protein|nr:MAG: hypothetical protein C4527_08555 [Candidatus Omnitrophota bacterium]
MVRLFLIFGCFFLFFTLFRHSLKIGISLLVYDYKQTTGQNFFHQRSSIKLYQNFGKMPIKLHFFLN